LLQQESMDSILRHPEIRRAHIHRSNCSRIHYWSCSFLLFLDSFTKENQRKWKDKLKRENTKKTRTN
jgi:hypothetical protein